mmetsp:Transcript_22200/g.29703  ORF Transcript_22200/g.29703 Transcript_22200/m.29703 type:complete len:86 (+) Transcript_22200:46-303(+)
MLTDKNWIKKVMHGGEKTHVLIAFESLSCQECRKYATTLAMLAEQTKGAPMVARAYCDLSAQHFCGAMQVDSTPAVLLVDGRSVH